MTAADKTPQISTVLSATRSSEEYKVHILVFPTDAGLPRKDVEKTALESVKEITYTVKEPAHRKNQLRILFLG
mgnify:CR=1 FL=1